MPIDNTKKVSVVDDHETVLGTIRRLLRHFVIGDRNMRPMTGSELLTGIRQDAKWRILPSIMVVTESQIETIAAAGQARIRNSIVKPVDVETSEGKIEKVLCHA